MRSSLLKRLKKDDRRKVRNLFLYYQNSFLARFQYILLRSRFSLIFKIFNYFVVFLELYFINQYLDEDFSKAISIAILYFYFLERFFKGAVQNLRIIEFCNKKIANKKSVLNLSIILQLLLAFFSITLLFFIFKQEEIRYLLFFIPLAVSLSLSQSVLGILSQRIKIKTYLWILLPLRIVPVLSILIFSNSLIFLIFYVLVKTVESTTIFITSYRAYQKTIRTDFTGFEPLYNIKNVLNKFSLRRFLFPIVTEGFNLYLIHIISERRESYWKTYLSCLVLSRLIIYLSRRVLQTYIPDLVKELSRYNLKITKIKIKTVINDLFILNSTVSVFLYILLLIPSFNYFINSYFSNLFFATVLLIFTQSIFEALLVLSQGIAIENKIFFKLTTCLLSFSLILLFFLQNFSPNLSLIFLSLAAFYALMFFNLRRDLLKLVEASPFIIKKQPSIILEYKDFFNKVRFKSGDYYLIVLDPTIRSKEQQEFFFREKNSSGLIITSLSNGLFLIYSSFFILEDNYFRRVYKINTKLSLSENIKNFTLPLKFISGIKYQTRALIRKFEDLTTLAPQIVLNSQNFLEDKTIKDFLVWDSCNGIIKNTFSKLKYFELSKLLSFNEQVQEFGTFQEKNFLILYLYGEKKYILDLSLITCEEQKNYIKKYVFSKILNLELKHVAI